VIRGVVVEKREGHVVFRVTKVLKEWRHSRAQEAEALIGKNVLVAPGKHDSIRHFVAQLKPGQELSLDVAHKDGEAMTILELTEDQRERVKR